MLLFSLLSQIFPYLNLILFSFSGLLSKLSVEQFGVMLQYFILRVDLLPLSYVLICYVLACSCLSFSVTIMYSLDNVQYCYPQHLFWWWNWLIPHPHIRICEKLLRAFVHQLIKVLWSISQGDSLKFKDKMVFGRICENWKNIANSFINGWRPVGFTIWC